jgi:tetratricopeptide (TPR) repeat protein
MPDDTKHLFGTIAITHRFMMPQQINECLDIQARIKTYGLDEKKIGEIALERRFITEQQLALILNIQRAVVEEKLKKEEAARPAPPPAPAPPRRRVRTPAPPMLKAPAHRVAARPAAPRPAPVPPSSAPAARSKIDEYTAQIKLGRITTIVGLCIAGLIVIIVLVKLGGGNEKARNSGRPGPAVVDPNPGLDEEHKRVMARRRKEAEAQYQEIKEWAAKHPDMKEEIIKRCNRIAVNFAETEAATKARQLADDYAEGKVEPVKPSGDRKVATPESQLFYRLTAQATVLIAKGQWGKAIAVYEQFPDDFKDTQWHARIQSQMKKLRQKIAGMFEADLRTINRLVAAKRYDEARQQLAKIENYATHDRIVRIQEYLDSYITERKTGPEPAPAVRPDDVVLADKLRIAETMFWRNMYKDALGIYEELSGNADFARNHPEIDGRKRDLERSIAVLDAAAKDIVKSKGRKRRIYLEAKGSIRAEILDVYEHGIMFYEKGKGGFEIPLTDVKTSSLMLFAKKYMPVRTAETELALGTFLLSRGDLKNAEKHFYAAVKRGADNKEFNRLVARLKEKPPPIAEGPIASAPKKTRPEETGDSTKLFADAEAMFKKDKFAEARTLYKKLLEQFARSTVVKEKKSQIREKLAACEKKLSSPLARLFSGKVIERKDLGKGVIEVSYDFESDKQLADWKEYNWYSIFDMHDSNWHITNGELQGNGSHGFLWKGVISGDVKVEFDAYSTSADRQNIQATICDDGEWGYNYLFALGLTELGDPKDIIRRNEKFSMGKEIARRASEAKSFNTYHVKIIKKGSQLSLYVDDELILRTKHTKYTKGHVGLFAMGSTVRFDNFTVTGRLDKQWLGKQGK